MVLAAGLMPIWKATCRFILLTSSDASDMSRLRTPPDAIPVIETPMLGLFFRCSLPDEVSGSESPCKRPEGLLPKARSACSCIQLFLLRNVRNINLNQVADWKGRRPISQQGLQPQSLSFEVKARAHQWRDSSTRFQTFMVSLCRSCDALNYELFARPL